ncbi:MAG: TrkA family potassium uptake protein [Clostridia bacterium]|nr:TrkA family potassium uptake protein [Clostridia bacterium]
MKKNGKKQYLVLGLGRFGAAFAESLCAMGHEVLAVDSDEKLVDEVAPLVTQTVCADATDEDVLASLDPASFDAVLVSIGSGVRDSILAAVLLKEMGVPYIVAKASDELHAKVLRKVGVDRVVFPERDMGQRLARSMATQNFLDMMELNDEYQMVEVVAPQAWQGKTLLQVNVRRLYGVSIIAIRRDGQFIASPGAEEVFRPGDVLLVLGTRSQIDQLEQ